MIRGSRLLAATALAVSGTLHLAGVSFFGREAPNEIDGGSPATVARLGNSFQDVAQGTQVAETPEAVQHAEPTETRAAPVRPEPAARVVPDPATAHTRHALVTRAPTPDAARAMPAATPVRSTAAQVPPTAPLRPEPAASVSIPVEPPEAKASPDTVEPVAPSPAKEPNRPELAPPEPTVLAALPQEEDAIAPLISTRPNLRPREVEDAARKAAPRHQPKRTAPAPGSDQPQQVRGSTDGERTASRTETSDRQSADTRSGNAAASNYPGEVMRAISRQRRPNVNNRGTATVSFQIAANGALAGLGVARSSGSQALDAAAVELVRRAAPFPPPPTGARRSFTIGIEGR